MNPQVTSLTATFKTVSAFGTKYTANHSLGRHT
jgi:hypothetical protein